MKNLHNKSFLALALLAAVPGVVSAANSNIGGCGWGSKLFDGNSGLAPQVLAVTTNGTSGNQTFGMTSNTSGCTRSGVVETNWKGDAFASSNMTQLALDISRGEGESLNAMAELLGVEKGDKALFASTLKDNFGTIFPSSDVSSQDMLKNLRDVLAANSELAKYA